ncbi:fumarylacetoacetate (FAA) hydrolase family protein [Rhizobium mesoamericanum]|uniref:fumarylacetoacetate hydrolase family protein n=1 Tax=Rhizobium mesoamericanum TaxID=1079800 RepID=UPI00277F2E30|nr:fumarylacetoacetate hydrolase family protein [Rhizobium mesoamericanum]MDQ0563189.1 fumarylacetoacetate (FAA) hydrolase family protein [Rhizobium mesoamericanum]
MQRRIRPAEILPDDADATLIGRVWLDEASGPCPVVIDRTRVRDISALGPTVSHILNLEHRFPENRARFPIIGELDDFLSQNGNTGARGSLLAPNDLQVVKAAGVTFVDSMLERVIEERAKGNPTLADAIRGELKQALGDQLSSVVPGSEAAIKVKAILQSSGHWSQYLEVGIGPDAEIFTKASPMSSVGCGAMIGINPISSWNNPEPEVVLAVNARGEIKGATLGNDVNLRDIEGRSALLLSKAKDNNGACAVGPFIRLFDDRYTLAAVEAMSVQLHVSGTDGFVLDGTNDMSRISRSLTDLVRQTINSCHQYPDGFMLFLGTMFAPVQDRAEQGLGFTHQLNDEVRISSSSLGTLLNWVGTSDQISPWSFGIGDLMSNLAKRGLLR